jgi:hypothetical protein
MIKTITDALKDILGPKSNQVECAIDETVVDCDKLEAPIHECGPSHFSHGYSPYVGVPAPAYLNDDEWFGPAPEYTEKQKDYMVQETEIKRQEFEKSFSVEPEDIHQVMYDMATQSAATTLQLDPIGGSENFQGGSENVHR